MSAMDKTSDSLQRGLSKLRRIKKDPDRNDSNGSLLPPQDGGNGGLRASIDGAIGKLKDHTRKSDERRGSVDSISSSRLSKLPIPLTLPRKSRRKTSADDIASRSNSIGNDLYRQQSPSLSELSIGLEGSGHSSLMTEDSDQEEPTRPTLSPHNSHAGYLTFSSPLLQTQAPATLDKPTAIDTVTASDTNTLQTSSTTASLDQPPPLQRRVSPSDRFKGAFTFAKRRSGIEPDSSGSAGTGGGDLADSVGGREKSDSLIGPQSLSIDTKRHSPPPSNDTVTTNDLSTPKQSPHKPAVLLRPYTPPNLVDTPTTFVTPPTPVVDQWPSFPESPEKSSPSSANNASQRRKKTGTFTSSKLSNTTNASPLTTHIEEAKTPGGTLSSPQSPATAGASGFFSSVFTAAQNAATQLTNSINTTLPNQKPKPVQPESSTTSGGEEVIPGIEDQSLADKHSTPKRQLAVETLGQGDLSLSHLGISEDSEVSPMNSQVDLSGQSHSSTTPSCKATAEESAAARAVSVAYEKPARETVAQALGARPLSIASADGSEIGTRTPPRSSVVADSVRRTGSVRSRLSERKRARTRGSSAGTAGASTLAAAVASSIAAVSNPASAGGSQRLTGFAVASSKRNKDFHQLFRSVPEDDYLIEDYSAALQRDILLHGRLYISEGHICFSSNILGWVTNLVISFDEIVSVEKKSTAVIFPNAIVIQTLHARNVFASLVARDSTYDLLIGIWKISHPNLKSSLNGVTIDDAGTGDKTEKAGSVASDEVSDDGSEDEVYDEDDDDRDANSFYEPIAGDSRAGSEAGDTPVSRKTSNGPSLTLSVPGQAPAVSTDQTTPVNPGQLPGGPEFPGPATHAATECADEASHYPNKLTDITIPAPLGKVYSLIWGPQSSKFMRAFLVDNQKSRELDFAPTPGGLDDTHKELVYSYIKPLYNPMGPKQTKCIVTAKLEDFDLEKAVSVGCSTATPDVPSGGVFETKTRYCLMWGPGNSTRFVASCAIEWSGKSWLKGPIEKGANDGQIQYTKDLIAALRAAVLAKAPTAGKGVVGKKGRSRRREKDVESPSTEAIEAKTEAQSNWGPFEILRGPLEPVTSIFGPMISAQVVIAFLVLLLAYSWFWPGGPRSSRGVGYPITSPERLAAYEEMWRREESELWEWLDDRVGLMDGVPVARYTDGERQERQRALGRMAMGKRMGSVAEESKMGDVQMDDAIRVTEEKLAALKDAVQRKREGK